MEYRQICIDPDIMHGTPVYSGTRVPIKNLFDYLEGGEGIDAFLEDFPSVEREMALDVLEMAKETLTSKKVLDENFA
ncbi:MAG: DUF433 domain-containing protein [Chitinophagales bacterium]|jgi:uncharacterized protein (DUF433 family)|nr:DUF433 domain-containing protein [Sphingobacteriales bacterium]